MPIQTPPPPPEALTAMRESAPTETEKLREQALQLAPPHQVFTSTLVSVLKRRVLADAQLTAWRDVTANSAAEVAERAGKFVVTSINEGPFVAATGEAIMVAEELDAVAQRDYELRLLSIPALFTVALWLSAENDNILIPLAPTPSGLRANTPYGEAAFTEALRPLAERRSTDVIV